MSVRSGNRAHLRLLGCVRLESADPVQQQLNQRPRLLALLAILACARSDGVSRDRLLSLLWPESDAPKARNALNQSVFAIRQALGEACLISEGMTVRLDDQVLSTDIGALLTAAADAADADVLALAVGDFLDSVHLVPNREFERWVDDTRAIVRRVVLASLARSAESARRDEDKLRLLTVLRRRAIFSPLDSTAALELMQALAAAGDYSAALSAASEHAAVVARELAVAPSAEIIAFERELRRDNGRRSSNAVLTSSVEREVPPSATQPAVGAGSANHHRWRLSAIAAAAILCGGGLRYVATRGRETALRGELIAVLPFDVRGASASVSYLARGMPELLADEMQVASSVRIVPSSIVSRALGSDSDVVSSAIDSEIVRVGQTSGARRVVVGSVFGTSDHLVLRASLITVDGQNHIVDASVAGPSDSLSQLADHLAGELLAGQSGFVGPRAQLLARLPLSAIRQYLDGMIAFRAARFDKAADHFRNALAYDSTFALAALGLASTSIGDAAGASGALAHALQIAWASRKHLPPPDSAYLRALIGPRYPQRSSMRESYGAWTAATIRAPDRPETWFGLGDRYFHEGAILGLPEALASARIAFERALEADSSFSPAVEHLLDVAIRTRDTAAVRQWLPRYLALDSTGPMADFVRWHAASALQDPRSQPSLSAVDTMPMLTLRWIMEIAPYDGIGMRGAIRALQARDQRPNPSIGERIETALARHSLALNRGRPHEAAAIRSELAALEPNDYLNLRFPILAALYGEGDSVAAAAAVEEMSKHFGLPAASAIRDASGSLDNLEALCVMAQWRLQNGNRLFAVEAAKALRQAVPQKGLDSEPLFCAVLLERSLSGRPTERIAQLDTLDSLVSTGENLHRAILYAPQAVARLFDAAGKPDRALAVVRRRGFFGRWPYYLATQLSEEARYALAVGDTTGATCALRHVVALRVDPEPPLRAALASDVAALAKLSNAPVARPCVR